jgi:prephenate dehydrogenase
MTITIIGLGLIGGSLGLDLAANGFATGRIGVDASEAHCAEAVALGLVDRCLPLEAACAQADIVILAVPVVAMQGLLPKVLDAIRPEAVVTDVGSTKSAIVEAVNEHPHRGRFVAAHPMAGTEFSGPQAAIPHLFHGKAAIICDAEDSDDDALRLTERLFKGLFMRIIHMGSRDHDVHAAYVSHISHISSFVLALTVLEKEQSEANIFDLASGGFDSTVRLAKSSPRMWTDVFLQNKKQVLDVLDEYAEKLSLFRQNIENQNEIALFSAMKEANRIGKILTK